MIKIPFISIWATWPIGGGAYYANELITWTVSLLPTSKHFHFTQCEVPSPIELYNDILRHGVAWKYLVLGLIHLARIMATSI